VPLITAISPEAVTAGSSNVTLTITGANFENYTSIAFWTSDPNNLHDHGTMLSTIIFVKGRELVAVIPAALPEAPTSMQIIVLTGDPMGMSDGCFGYPKSNTVTFGVTP